MKDALAVYPCTHRERCYGESTHLCPSGISLYPQGTQLMPTPLLLQIRYIPVPTGNANTGQYWQSGYPVYPCTHRERNFFSHIEIISCGISLYPQGTQHYWVISKIWNRYIPVPTGNAPTVYSDDEGKTVYPCTHRERWFIHCETSSNFGISLYPQGTRHADTFS